MFCHIRDAYMDIWYLDAGCDNVEQQNFPRAPCHIRGACIALGGRVSGVDAGENVDQHPLMSSSSCHIRGVYMELVLVDVDEHLDNVQRHYCLMRTPGHIRDVYTDIFDLDARRDNVD